MKVSRRQFLWSLLGAAGASLTGSAGRIAGAALPSPAQTTPHVRRWVMLVDVAACGTSGSCTDCIEACNRAHNVPDLPVARQRIEWIKALPFEQVLPDERAPLVRDDLGKHPVLSLCNHCDNPPCVPVCPTKATFRRDDGIVMMDFHRCIGCRYCMAACPFGARSFNWQDPRPFIKELNPNFPTRTKGVVEKCNFCEERLAKGQIPACVEACKERGLSFFDLNDPGPEDRKILQSRYFVVRRPSLGTRPSVFYLVR